MKTFLNLPVHLLNANIAKYLNPKNKLKLRTVSKNIANIRVPSQRMIAKSILPRRKPINVNMSRKMRMIPAHLPGGRYTAGHNRIQNLLAQYTLNSEKEQRLAHIQNTMERNQFMLGKRIKKLFMNKNLVNKNKKR